MTGHGEAQETADGVTVSVELRTLNSRYLKVSTRLSDGYGSLESQVEAVVRRQVHRGTAQVTVHVRRDEAAENYRFNEDVLAAYWQQLEKLTSDGRLSENAAPISLDNLLMLPGVIQQAAAVAQPAEDWPLIESVLTAALADLAAMRRREGDSMQADLLANLGQIDTELDAISARAPQVAEAYQQRLTERLKKLLADYDIAVEPADVIREVGLFAERSDISEEIVRLRSHTEQFRETTDGEENPGRKLEFVTQEMFRETNTIGSKANDAQISKHVIEIKGAIERIREMIQNVE